MFAQVAGKRYINSSTVIADANPKFLLEILTLGDIDLYYRPKNSSNNTLTQSFFIRKQGAPTQELIRIEKEIVKGGLTYSASFDAYKNQLKNLFADCPSLKIDRYGDFYNENKMLKVVNNYSKCKGYTLVYMKKPKKDVFHLIAGFDLSTFHLNTGYSSSSTSFFPFIGAQLTSSISKKNIEVIFDALIKRTVNTYVTYQKGTTINRETLSKNYLTINIGLQNQFIVSPKLKAGIQVGLSVSSIFLPSVKSSDSGIIISNPNSTIELGYYFGAKLDFGKIEWFVRDGFSNDKTFFVSGFPWNSIYSGIKIKFTKTTA